MILRVMVIGWATLVAVASAESPAPAIHEHFDAVIVVRFRRDTTRVVFVRHGKPVAERLWVDDMLDRAQGGCFAMEWFDRYCCHRVVTFDHYAEIWVKRDYADKDCGGEWWAMRRRMTDLEWPD